MANKNKVWFKVKIKSCCTKCFWYLDKIGETLLVKEPYENSWGFETKNGCSIYRHDCERIY